MVNVNYNSTKELQGKLFEFKALAEYEKNVIQLKWFEDQIKQIENELLRRPPFSHDKKER